MGSWTRLNRVNIPKNFATFQYPVVQGPIQRQAEAMLLQMSQKSNPYPFKHITPLNIGETMLGGLKPLTFARSVLSCILSEKLQESNVFSHDVRERAKLYAREMGPIFGGKSGDPRGFELPRQKVADYIQKRDKVEHVDINDIFIISGASEGGQLILRLILSQKEDFILLPKPVYPLYSAIAEMLGGSTMFYENKEAKIWEFDVENFKKSIKEAKDRKINIKVAAIINPGNPGGYLMTEQQIKDVIEACYENKILILADEVLYRNLRKGAEFHSFRKVLTKMGEPYLSQVELVSLNSASKGALAEGGFRGGYMELTNISQEAIDIMCKIKSLDYCTNIVGQAATILMVDPPQRGRESDETVDEYQADVKRIMDALNGRSDLMLDVLNNIEGITCAEYFGGAHAYPRLHLPEKVQVVAKNQGLNPIDYYCLELLKNKGIAAIAGTAFFDNEDVYHMRLANLIHPNSAFEQVLKDLKQFHEQFIDQH